MATAVGAGHDLLIARHGDPWYYTLGYHILGSRPGRARFRNSSDLWKTLWKIWQLQSEALFFQRLTRSAHLLMHIQPSENQAVSRYINIP